MYKIPKFPKKIIKSKERKIILKKFIKLSFIEMTDESKKELRSLFKKEFCNYAERFDKHNCIWAAFYFWNAWRDVIVNWKKICDPQVLFVIVEEFTKIYISAEKRYNEVNLMTYCDVADLMTALGFFEKALEYIQFAQKNFGDCPWAGIIDTSMGMLIFTYSKNKDNQKIPDLEEINKQFLI